MRAIDETSSGAVQPVARRTQASRRQASTQRMLDAALQLLGERRSLAFSLADVADRAGFSRGQPTHIFGTREEMIRQLVPHLHVKSDEIFGPTSTRGVGLRAVLRTAELLLDPRSEQAVVTIAIHVLLAEAADPASPMRDAVARVNDAAVGYIARELDRARADGEVDAAGDNRARGMLIMAMIRGALLQWLVAPTVPIRVLRAQLLGTIRRDLGLDGGSDANLRGR